MKQFWLTLFLLLLGAGARADVKPLPQSQWPRTVAEAVPPILASLTPTQQSIVSNTSKENLFWLQGEWGDDIGQLLGLNSGNMALREAACGHACPVEQATLKLMEASWEALRP
jgi:hypothetical protein